MATSGKNTGNDPVLQALILADHVYEDAGTGKKIIAGTFNALWSATFPQNFSRPTFAYVCLTDIRGGVRISLKYVDLASDQVLMETAPIEISSPDPLQSVELCFPIPTFPMPHPGAYAFEVHAGSTLLGFLRIKVNRMEEKTP